MNLWRSYQVSDYLIINDSCQSQDYVCLLVKVKEWGWLSVEQLPGMPEWGARCTT